MSTDRKEERMDKQIPQGDTPTNDVTPEVAPTEETKRELIAALQQNWQREVQGARTYYRLWSVHSDHSLLLPARHPGHYCSGDHQPGCALCGRRGQDAGDRSLLVQ